MLRQISYHSFDFDGCIFSRSYIISTSKDRLIKKNNDLLASIAKKIHEENYDQVITFIGSNRQSKDCDDANITIEKGSCYPTLHELTNNLKERLNGKQCEADTYLLADSYGDRPEGENFENALKQNTAYDFSHWIFDDEKLSLLYAQIHRAASKNPDAEIVFNFYDDRYIVRDILNKLSVFFQSNPDLLPKNATLRLHHYEGGPVKQIAEIKGQGEIDFNYQKNLKLMAECAGYSLPKNEKDYELCHFIKRLTENNNEKLTQLKSQRKLSPLASPTLQVAPPFLSLFSSNTTKVEVAEPHQTQTSELSVGTTIDNSCNGLSSSF